MSFNFTIQVALQSHLISLLKLAIYIILNSLMLQMSLALFKEKVGHFAKYSKKNTYYISFSSLLFSLWKLRNTSYILVFYLYLVISCKLLLLYTEDYFIIETIDYYNMLPQILGSSANVLKRAT